MTKDIELEDYKKVLEEARQTITGAQEQFLQQATRTSIELYWQLGGLLAKIADRYQWGKQVLGRLSYDLTKAFSNTRGYSEQNLRHMRQFYYEYAEARELEPRVKTYQQALFSPTTSSVDPKLVLKQMLLDAQDEGINVHFGVKYLGNKGNKIKTSQVFTDGVF